MSAPPAELLAPLLARERRRVVALLARQLGLAELSLAEDAVQTASLRALQHWPRSGPPERPAAWLYRVAQHWALDQLRAQGRQLSLPDNDGDALLPPLEPPAGRFAGELDDDELALLFAACHPELPAATQVLLALRSMTGLGLAELAPLLFTQEAALAQRLARARARLAGLTLTLPAGAELAPRREAVLTALALVFHQGQLAAGRAGAGLPASPQAYEACWEAIRLARALAAHPACAAPEADALAALLLLHGARLSGRIDAEGDLIPLAGQPRERWDAGMIRLGLQHLRASQRGERLSRWHLQAGIAAEHAMAATPEATRWPVIVRYYELLLALDPSHAPRLGHAIALAEAGQVQPARERLNTLLPTLPAALRAHGLAALARTAEYGADIAQARTWLEQAAACAPDAAQARLLRARAAGLAGLADGAAQA
ncbi:MAG: hypothetical protein DI603_15390 [Roseateles depolymerans]|uniref:Uncharacterized protein n=1 Tax=Roseateles depolymerans TaxID=76731 RepID=A0A2W5DHW2_9BURK|nr:MAG: hypothetical protein DI603_15390 [Roseateles depolymerans]